MSGDGVTKGLVLRSGKPGLVMLRNGFYGLRRGLLMLSLPDLIMYLQAVNSRGAGRFAADAYLFAAYLNERHFNIRADDGCRFFARLNYQCPDGLYG